MLWSRSISTHCVVGVLGNDNVRILDDEAVVASQVKFDVLSLQYLLARYTRLHAVLSCGRSHIAKNILIIVNCLRLKV